MLPAADYSAIIFHNKLFPSAHDKRISSRIDGNIYEFPKPISHPLGYHRRCGVVAEGKAEEPRVSGTLITRAAGVWILLPFTRRVGQSSASSRCE